MSEHHNSYNLQAFHPKLRVQSGLAIYEPPGFALKFLSSFLFGLIIVSVCMKITKIWSQCWTWRQKTAWRKILISRKLTLSDLMFQFLQNRMSSLFKKLLNVLSFRRIQMLLPKSHLVKYACVSSWLIEAWSYILAARSSVNIWISAMNACFKI